MNSKFHYHIDLNEDQNNQPLPLSSSPSFSSSSSSSPTSSLSYLPFFNPPIDHGGYFHGDHSRVLFQSQEEVKEIVSIGGSCDHVTHTNETRLKLTIRKKDGKIYDQDHKMSSKMMKNQRNISDKNGFNEDRLRRSSSTKDQDYHGDVYNNNKNIINGVIRVCSDCNTTKTPLWRSGPSGPKSLCNACGIRQRKARRAAAMAAAGGSGQVDNAPAVPTVKKTNKRSTKNQNGGSFHVKKKCKITAEDNSVTETKTPSSSTKLCFDDLTIILSKSSAFQKVFPQDEKEAAILLMAMSYGMVCS